MIIVGFRLILRGGCDPSCQRGRRDDYLPDVFVVVVATTTFLCRGCGNDHKRARGAVQSATVHAITKR
jgi:hypothetical protein